MVVISAASLLLFSVYLIYDIQLIAGGEHKRMNQLSSDDYILAAINIYLDILVIFLELLRLIGGARGK